MPVLWKLLHTVTSGAALGFPSLKMTILLWTLNITRILNLNLDLGSGLRLHLSPRFYPRQDEKVLRRELWSSALTLAAPSQPHSKSSRLFHSPNNKHKTNPYFSSGVAVETEPRAAPGMWKGLVTWAQNKPRQCPRYSVNV